MSKLTLKMDLWKVEKDGALRVQFVPTRESQGQAVAPLKQQPLLSRRIANCYTAEHSVRRRDLTSSETAGHYWRAYFGDGD